MRQKTHRSSSQKVKKETRIEERKIMTSLREGPNPKIKSNVSLMEKKAYEKKLSNLEKGT